VAPDVAGVGLSLGSGGHLLAGVPHQVVATLLPEAGPVGEEHPLRGQLVVDVVVGEVGAPGEKAAGDGEHDRRDHAEPDQELVYPAPRQPDDLVFVSVGPEWTLDR
jgi:hypothetical protein